MDFAGKDKATYVQETFNSIAGHYDFMNSLMSLGMDKRWRRLAVQRVGAKPGMHMLDVCCGTGQLSMELGSAVGVEGTVTGLDFSHKMLDVAKRSLEQSFNKDRIKFIQGNAMELPFPSNTFDGATVGWGLRNLPDLRQGIKEMVRTVKPGGRIVSLDMAKPTFPGFKQAYWLYFEKLIPLMGKIWARKASAYQYLHDSAREFPAQEELVRIFTECGLVETRFDNLAGGVVAIVSGTKPD
ncbi:demethylmenaquinone methyltransferase [Desulfosporosinus sp. BICA1-9]|uniref:demethylmenaquinone methyltransferase n=1 Tax=Desulfosporosinus sp. BICA1-9 TaxID=1531958 RepID=UPI00054C1B61|nr:demethylmenaquinone methyltransferase [Desulfosporosinus sp. BICA1-9]KJS50415.1 MAG: ubiquinone biosynthesis methyltransferase UbiE [Peptococcaceae bacterium BRH_c23]KJS82249.1 MAG: ubiquinone biosynthesis methyltransferase UbiE [Desulfosporosinus sp. BICA1-9]KJS88989.1 MAG: ubiquinone biosynthesis methyltransferase UbiE [Desulfosporosinus sp. BICA1-9]HBW37981.1 demethylmenaquinone methyltransferase [Desulfosporosinus sp.]